MTFSRFFGRGRDAAPSAPQPADAPAPDDAVEAASDASGDDETSEVDDTSPEDASQRTWRERAEAVMPTGASTGSKRAVALWGDDVDLGLPTHLLSARGCRVVDVQGNSYVDCTMALGSVALG